MLILLDIKGLKAKESFLVFYIYVFRAQVFWILVFWVLIHYAESWFKKMFLKPLLFVSFTSVKSSKLYSYDILDIISVESTSFSIQWKSIGEKN